LVQRAGMILQLINGNPLDKVAEYWHCTERTVKKWADRFVEFGIKGLFDLPRTGRPQVYTSDARLQVVSLACQYPGEKYLPGVTHWSVRSLTRIIHKCFKEIGKISFETVRRILNSHHLKPHQAKQVIELYQSPPEDGVVICVDERTGIQALERKHPGLPMIPGHCQRQEFEYKRHGTFCLIAGLNILTGKVFGQCYKRHTNIEFRDFLEQLVALYPEQKLYIILDNLKTHLHSNVKELLTKHDMQFIFLPFHGSWTSF